jgi:phenylacetate-CoA ligase
MNPYLVRCVISPLLERVMGRSTFRAYRELMHTQWFNHEQLRELQLTKLRELLAIALNGTPAYADLADVDRSWRPVSLEDLRDLPLLDKATISANRERLVNRSVPGGPQRYNTGGSTGEPLIFYLDKRREAYDKAARMRSHHWWGIRTGDREAYIWGSPVELSKQDRLKRFRDRITNELLLSAFDLSEDNIGSYVERLRRFRPSALFGYPSSITLLCKLTRRARYDLTDLPVQVVFSTAEVLYDHQREIISESFGGAPVANGYGSREGGFIAHECPEGHMHITSENIIVEFIRDAQVVPPGGDGEIVLTHLDNYAMPFIRYRTGDIGSASKELCPCGRGLEVMQIVKGRATDFIITPDGRWVHGLALIYVLREIPGLREYQIVQNDVDSICVRVVPDGTFPEDGVKRILTGVVKRLGSDVGVSIEQVKQIAPEASGKFRYVISEVARDREALL